MFYRIGNSTLGMGRMPVTVRLSKLFYDRLGEEIADEIVNWVNQVDATYRADLRELNELNFGRFDAKLEQRLAEVRAELRSESAELRAELRGELVALRTELRTKLAELNAMLERRLGDHTRWLFVAWASLLIPIIGLWIRR